MQKAKSCEICRRILGIRNGTNQYFVLELETGYVVLGDFQFFKGYTLFLYKKHISELHQLKQGSRAAFLREMGLVGEAVFRAFRPKKLNYELLGNTDHHLHWHIFPRHKNDPKPLKSVWHIDKQIRNADEYRPNKKELINLKKRLRRELIRLIPSVGKKRLHKYCEELV